MLDLPRIHAVLFDVDGTLSDTDDAYIERVALRLRRLGRLFPNRDPRRFLRWGLMASETPANFLMTVPDRLGLDGRLERLFDAVYRMRGLGASHRFLLIDGVREMLERLKPLYPMAVVTSRNLRGTQAFLAQFDLSGYFQLAVTSLAAPRIKPHPAPILFAARTLGVNPGNCLMVGDTTVDILAGRRAGAQTAGVLCGFGERPELARAGADLILESTAELAEALLSASRGG